MEKNKIKLPNKSGGGSKTNVNGLTFEQTTSLKNTLENNGYNIINDEIFKTDLKDLI
jgi:hypothetical protein